MEAASGAEVIWTVGHSNRSWEGFLALLRSQAIERVADVRRFAGSRKHPQFSTDVLPAELAKAHVDYQWIQALGGRRSPHSDSPHTVWRNAAFRAYADFMDTDEYRLGRASLLKAAAGRRTAIMCSEAVWWRCHRSMIADDLKASGVRVMHIMSPTKATEHPYTAPASIRDGVLYYGKADPHAPA